MDTKWKVALAAIALLTAFASGRWLAPEKVKIEKQVVTVKEKVKVKDEDKHVHKETTVTETTKPDGTKEVVTVVVEDNSDQTKVSQNETDTKTKDEVKEIERGTSKVTLSALGGLAFDQSTPVYGAAVSKPILGPITIGLWALSSKTAGASLGLTF